MSRPVRLVTVVAVAAAAVLARRRHTAQEGEQSRVAQLLRGRRDALPKGVQTYPSQLVDRRGPSPAGPWPDTRPETPAEVTADFYDARDDS